MWGDVWYLGQPTLARPEAANLMPEVGWPEWQDHAPLVVQRPDREGP